MDKNTTTGLILIGAVVLAFMFLNKPQEPSVTNTTATEFNNIDSSNSEVINSVNTTSQESAFSDIDSADMIIYQKLKDQQDQEELIERFGVFFRSVSGQEKNYSLENDKIKLSFSNKGARITNAEMVELGDNGLFKYRTYQDFINNENNPLSLFDEETSTMSLSLVDAEKVVPIESEDLFFKLVKQNDTLLVFRSFAGSDDNATGTIYKFRRIWSDIDTLDRATAEEYRDNKCGEFDEEQIKLIDINQLLDQLPKVNFINIDVEGVDSTIIKNLDFKKFLPDAILFEDNHNWDGSAEVIRILHKHGYKHLFTSGGSICYVQPL